VAVTPKVKGIVDETAANFVGIVSGMAADDVMCEALEAADLLIGFGLDPVEVDKIWHADLPIHWILEAPNVGGLVPQGTELIDHAQFLDAMVKTAPPSTWHAPFGAFQERRRAKLNDRSGASGVMWPGDIITALAAVLPPETIVTTDVGSHKYLFGQYWPSRQPETFWMSNGLSGMGYGLSAAIGAKLARPDAPVLAAVGDGGFSMNAQELETAERVRRSLRHRGARRLELLAHQAVAGGKKTRAVSSGLRADRYGEDGRGLRRRRAAHQQSG
jgi:acetolactate synthase-1/2/3 large subunit